MKAVLDACVLYPSVLREVLLGAAHAGLFTPLWSGRILEEWARAAAKLGPAQEAIARGEIALTRGAFPKAEVPRDPGLESRLWLPDPNDIHVLASAIRGGADTVVTYNASDFPRGILAQEGLLRTDPDAFLLSLDRSAVAAVTQTVKARAEALSGEDWPLRKLLKKAGLPRLGKVLDP